MNIAQAKLQIKNAMTAYFSRDKYGNFIIPPEAQRPVFLMGPPGIGKTAVMKQIAQELGVGLVSYSMTHHTRQSALGLPVIVNKCYGGEACSVSEYTMSEIIASVYDMIETGGVKSGILFLDEINCVSETLTPTMLQFLQYKTFGKHRVPEGWIVVTAGNPPEYNRSAREFDIVTWDRLKRIDIEPDYSAWRDYALAHGVHASILSYLSARRENFYRVEHTAEGRRFVTARGWVDLSDMIKLYELNNIAVDKELIIQYLQDKDIADDFAMYYELFNKYKSDYQVELILGGSAPGEICTRAKAAPFDERLSLISLLLDSLSADFREIIQTEDMLKELLAILRRVKAGAAIAEEAEQLKERRQRDQRRGILSAETLRRYERINEFLLRQLRLKNSFELIKLDYDSQLSQMRLNASAAGEKLENMLRFAESVWGSGQEMLVVITELTINPYSARFISRYGSETYYKHNESLMLHQRHGELLRRLDELDSI